MSYGSVAFAGIVLLGSALMSVTASGAPALETLQPVTVRVESVPSYSSYGTGVHYGSGSRYSGGGGFGGFGK